MGAVRLLADKYLDEIAALDPNLATSFGLPGHDRRLTDQSPEGLAARAELQRRTLAELDRTEAEDDGDRTCAALLRDRLGVQLELFDQDELLRPLRVIGSPVGATRAVFDLMPRDTDEDWDAVAERLEAVPEAYRSLERTLAEGRRRGVQAPRRQAEACAEQAAVWAGLSNGAPWFAGYVAPYGEGPLRERLDTAATAATAALTSLHGELLDYAAAAPGHDPVGPDRYPLFVRQMLGASLDTTEAYEWAWDELARIEDEMVRTAAVVAPQSSATGLDLVHEAQEWLEEQGPAVDGEDTLRSYLQDLVDRTIDVLDGSLVDLDPRLRRCEVMIAPPGSAAAQYYTPPSSDFSRPGRTWNPTLGRTRFPLWGEVSTCYHEAVPGHHLQLAQWRVEAERLSNFQTTHVVSGNIEGWALYAERLMDELGYLADPGERLGYLVAQQLRATRVIVDIGMHLEMPIPEGQPFRPGERWTAEAGLEFLLQHAGKQEAFLRSEWVRYLGWPAQATSYKLGERVWLAGRDEAKARAGSSFDLKAWHTAALAMGSTGLDELAARLPTLTATRG